MKESEETRMLRGIYESAKALFDLGLMSAEEMKEYEEGCLPGKSEPQETSTHIYTPAPAYAGGMR